jgi:hypothetical protein
MPYIQCEQCGTSCYSNVLSCPKCRATVYRAYTHATASNEPHSSVGQEDVEHEVRDALYGWHSGCVATCQIKPDAVRETTSRSAPS